MLSSGLYFLLGFLAVCTSANAVQISITGGAIVGKTANTVRLGKPYVAFQGIPYAEPPERFQLAKPKKAWTGVLNCTFDRDQCVQGSNPVIGSEDCLTLSVYTPSITGNYSVFVWIHGGAFVTGNASYVEQGPDFILDEDVVFVQLQYRLGILGFLSTGDTVCPGNLGFKDQVLALQWVQQNIKFFGGDPTRVTLGGQSAGAVAVSLHLHSPKSKGLFRAAILNSGTSLNLWALHRRPKQTAYTIGERFGYFGRNSTKLLATLKKQSVNSLQSASDTISKAIALQNPLAGIFYGYVPEPDHPDAFFTGKSDQRLSQGDFTKVPVLFGFTSNEAAGLGEALNVLLRSFFLSYDLGFYRLAPADLTKNIFYRLIAGLQVKWHAFNLLPISFHSDDKISLFFSVDQWVRAARRFGIHISKYVNAYAYQFSYQGEASGMLFSQRDVPGVGHSEDLHYLFNRQSAEVSTQDSIIQSRVARLWINFVKFLNPTPLKEELLQNQLWPTFGSSGIPGVYNYYNIDSNITTITTPFDKDIQFYDRLYKRWGGPSFDTY